MSDVDLVIVGAGAAGLTAARMARQAGLSFALVEAKGRIGGRAFTEADSLGVAMDHGAHFFHAASQNPFCRYADARGIRYKRGGYRTQVHDGRWFTEEESQRFHRWARSALELVAGKAISDHERATADFLPAHPEFGSLFRGYYAEFLGATSEAVAASEHARYVDTFEDWPVQGGFGSLIADFGADVPVTLDCPVGTIDHSGGDILVQTSKGSLRSRFVVVTVSTGVLNGGTIHFAPRLPDRQLRAIQALPMGYAGKIAFRLEGRKWQGFQSQQVLVNRPDGMFANLHIRPFDEPVAILIVGGPKWEMLENVGSKEMIGFGREVIGDLLGADSLADLSRAVSTHWLSDPFVRGGHSYMRPGCGRARLALAEPIDGRIFFAGEATSEESWATVHGAHASACRAISRIWRCKKGESTSPGTIGK